MISTRCVSEEEGEEGGGEETSSPKGFIHTSYDSYNTTFVMLKTFHYQE